MNSQLHFGGKIFFEFEKRQTIAGNNRRTHNTHPLTSNNMTDPTPRVNRSMLRSYIGKTVRFVGRLKSFDPHQAVAYVEAFDGAVTVETNPMTQYPTGVHEPVVEVVGTVVNENTLKELMVIYFDESKKKFGELSCVLCLPARDRHEQLQPHGAVAAKVQKSVLG